MFKAENNKFEKPTLCQSNHGLNINDCHIYYLILMLGFTQIALLQQMDLIYTDRSLKNIDNHRVNISSRGCSNRLRVVLGTHQSSLLARWHGNYHIYIILLYIWYKYTPMIGWLTCDNPSYFPTQPLYQATIFTLLLIYIFGYLGGPEEGSSMIRLGLSCFPAILSPISMYMSNKETI